jgi:hypothetical protein
MKNHRPILLPLLLAATLPAAGCAKESTPAPASATRSEPAAPAAPEIAMTPAVPANPCAEMKQALEKATLEQHAGLSEILQRMDRELDTQVAAKKAAGADVSLALDKKLDTATDDFAEKLRMLTVATPETWESAKHDTGLALQNVSDAFAEVMNSPQRK